MDLDALAAARHDEWARLAELSKQRRFSGAEADELIELYQAGASDLSAIKTTIGSSVQGDRLSLDLLRARLRFTGTSVNVLRQLPAFFARQLPAALYRVRWTTLVIAAAFIAVAVGYGVWLAAHPAVLATLGTPQQLKDYANQEFVGYYSAHPEAAFAGQVWSNNAFIAAITITTGITIVFPIYMIATNATSVGMAGAIMDHYGRLDHFFLYISPHGQLELYSLFVATAAGLLVGWAWIAPGARTRGQALAEEGRALFTIVVGLILSLAVSGVIEGFVTRQDWPWAVKIGLGTIALAGFLFYQWGVGRHAFRSGETGDLDEFDAGARRIIAD